MFRSAVASALMLACIGLASCAPAPPVGIPRGAHAAWSLKGDWTWTWTRTLPSGCVAWMAKDRWASVQLALDSRCEEERDEGRLDGRGVSYFSSSDFLVFYGYWPWTQEEYHSLIEYDAEGMTSHIRPCPHSLAPEQLHELRALAQGALDAATTDGERRMLTRIAERLAATDGAALASGQSGCTDLPPDWYRGARPRQNPWTDR